MPHAWKPGPQTQLLKRQLDALEDGATIVMVAPPNPYRCPPGPYERVSMMAHVLKAKGHKNSRIVVLDPKDTFSKQGLFQEGWEKHYPGMVEWQDPKMHGGIKCVDAEAMTVNTDLADYKARPGQRHSRRRWPARSRAMPGSPMQTGFCPIDPASMKSANDPNIYVIGDACIAGDMPKSAFSANSQAKVAAMMIRGELTKSPTFPARYTNTCWSLIETDDTREGRRPLRAEGRQDRCGRDLRLQDRRERRAAQADPGGKHGLVSGHHRRHLLVMTIGRADGSTGDAASAASPRRHGRCSARLAAVGRAASTARGPQALPVTPQRRNHRVTVVSDGAC